MEPRSMNGLEQPSRIDPPLYNCWIIQVTTENSSFSLNYNHVLIISTRHREKLVFIFGSIQMPFVYIIMYRRGVWWPSDTDCSHATDRINRGVGSHGEEQRMRTDGEYLWWIYVKFVCNIIINNSSHHLSIVLFKKFLAYSFRRRFFVCVFELFTNVLLTFCLYCL